MIVHSFISADAIGSQDRVSKLSFDEPLVFKHGILWIPLCLVFGGVVGEAKLGVVRFPWT